MAGFGGSPGLAILAGVADGISKREERKRAMQRDAIADRLRNAQVEQTNQEIAFAAARESRAASQAAAQATETARVAQERADTFEAIVQEHIKNGETRAEAQRHARVELETKESPEEKERKRKLDDQRLKGEEALAEQRRASAGASRASANASNARADKYRREPTTTTVPQHERDRMEIEASQRVEKAILDRMVATQGSQFDDDERRSLASKAILVEYRKLAAEVVARPGVTPEQIRKAKALVDAAERAAR
jgi:predicted membrane-bound mannosyltransferase